MLRSSKSPGGAHAGTKPSTSLLPSTASAAQGHADAADPVKPRRPESTALVQLGAAILVAVGAVVWGAMTLVPTPLHTLSGPALQQTLGVGAVPEPALADVHAALVKVRQAQNCLVPCVCVVIGWQNRRNGILAMRVRIASPRRELR